MSEAACVKNTTATHPVLEQTKASLRVKAFFQKQQDTTNKQKAKTNMKKRISQLL